MKNLLMALGLGLLLVSCSGDDEDTQLDCNCVKKTYALRLVFDPVLGYSVSRNTLISTEYDQCGVDGQTGAGSVEGSNYVMTCAK